MRFTIDPSLEAWEQFQTQTPWAQFTQSWAWGSFRASQGVKILRAAIEGKSGRWLIAAQLEYREKRGGLGYWYAPRGPVFSNRVPDQKKRKLLQRFIAELHSAGIKSSLVWRLEPMTELKKPEGLLPMIKKEGQPFKFIRVPALNPSATRVIDLHKDEEKLLSEMHQKTRYNMRIAEKRGVSVRLAHDQEDIERFLALIQETATRASFVSQSPAYLRDMVRMLSEREMIRIRMAERNDTLLAASLEILYGDTVTYLHGASSSEERDTMAPFALHWDAIKSAKQEGFSKYDLWGENPESQATSSWKASWEGITRFKKGWGGEHIDLCGTWDIPHSPRLYKLIFLPRFLRGILK